MVTDTKPHYRQKISYMHEYKSSKSLHKPTVYNYNTEIKGIYVITIKESKDTERNPGSRITL